MTTNPYAAPRAAVADQAVVSTGDFMADGRGVDAGRGWNWIAEGWELFKRQPGLWIGIIVVLVLLLIGVSLIPLVGPIAQMLFWPVIVAGLMLGCRELAEGRELEFAHLFAGFREQLGSLVGVGALALAAMVVIMLIVFAVMGVGMMGMAGGDADAMMAGGLTMLLAVLIAFALYLPVAMATWFAPPLVVFHGMGAGAAIKASFRGCLKNIVPFLVYGVVFMVLAVLASLPLGLGWLVLGPVMAASVYTGYRDIYFTPRA